MTLYDVLDKDLIKVQLDAVSSEDAIKQLVELYAKRKGTKVQPVLEAVLARESMGSTAIGNQVAIPHCKIESIDHCSVVIGICKNPVKFGTESVKLIFLVLSTVSDPTVNIQVLSAIARLCSSSVIRNMLMSARDSKSVFDVIAN